RALYGASDASSGDGVSRFALLAPLDGVVAEAHATVGEQVDPSRSLFTILDSRVVWVEANVFAGDVARVEAAREAVIHVEAYPGIDFHAPLINLGQLVDEATRTVRAIFEARNPDGKLRPGMFAEVAIGSGAPEHLLAVPLSALVEEGARRVVFVKVGPEHFVEREVKTGPRDGEHVAILGGLVEGELVVIQGVYQLRTAEH
ncbi:MAG: efflux RND transporter periplasmic adaptor subunit, partial [Myxococcales bacterium]